MPPHGDNFDKDNNDHSDTDHDYKQDHSFINNVFKIVSPFYLP